MKIKTFKTAIGTWLSLSLLACASIETRLPVPENALLALEADAQKLQAFTRHKNMQKRLDAVSAKVLQASAPLCEKTRIDTGIITHSEKSYPKYLREAAAQWNGAEKTPKVYQVRKGSSAAKAGVLPGDVILGAKSDPVSIFDKNLKLDQDVRFRRGKKEMSVPLGGPKACAYPVRLKLSGTINAYATGRSIIVTSGMMEFIENDEELALVVGHELAHNTMGHIRKGIQNTILSGFASRYTRPFEAEADYVGLYYMARAGYKLDDVEQFWRRLGVRSPKSIVSAKTHPVTPSRLLSIRQAALEITQKQEQGLPLTPNYIEGKGPSLEK